MSNYIFAIVLVALIWCILVMAIMLMIFSSKMKPDGTIILYDDMKYSVNLPVETLKELHRMDYITLTVLKEKEETK